MLSDGRFVVLSGYSIGVYISSCEALTLGDDEHWESFAPMHDSRNFIACATLPGCIIVAGGAPQRKSAEVYDEVLGRWLRLPCDYPHARGLANMGSALI